jgi:hypothetical protein
LPCLEWLIELLRHLLGGKGTSEGMTETVKLLILVRWRRGFKLHARVQAGGRLIAKSMRAFARGYAGSLWVRYLGPSAADAGRSYVATATCLKRAPHSTRMDRRGDCERKAARSPKTTRKTHSIRLIVHHTGSLNAPHSHTLDIVNEMYERHHDLQRGNDPRLRCNETNKHHALLAFKQSSPGRKTPNQ